MNIHFSRNKLHGNVIADVINGNDGILSDFGCNPVIKTVLKSLAGSRILAMILGMFVPLKRNVFDSPVESGVVGTYAVFKHAVKLC